VATIAALAITAIVGLAPASPALAARSCDEWSAKIVTVEGTAEVLRSGSENWTPLVAGDRVCSGETINVHGSSRVAVTLPDDSSLRIDEHTTLVVPDPPSGNGTLVEILRGVIHVISRDPRLLLFTTPYANAGLEGTEFDIRVDDVARRMEVVVLEGEVVVSNSAGRIDVASDQFATVDEGRSPSIATIPEPIELMRWASYYPSIVDYPLPSADEEPPASRASDPQFFADRAAARLSTARVDAAEHDLATALRLEPGNATALSLQAMIALASSDRATAQALVDRAEQSEANAIVTLLARSYVEERSQDLSAAEQSIRAVLAIEPDNALALTRLAEVALAQGDTPLAIESATRARRQAPARSTPLVVLGFAHLRGFDTASAQTSFEEAIALEPHAPLPRLALGLTLIQRGDELEGRRQIELAVTMDPANPLTRSYMARIYDTENRVPLTVTQLDLAKRFDPGDPTASLYSALQNLRSNRPVAALQDLRGAATKNGDRPVFRSSLGLDEDVATSSAALSRVHTELGFDRLALLDAWDALRHDSGDYAGHRLLADAYSTQPRHEIARVSELLVSQLMQPATVAPIKPQLAQPDLFISHHMTPGSASYDELGSPVLANGLKLRASAVRGGNATASHDVTLAGLHDQVSFSVGYYDFATDGFRENNDVDQRVASAFIQGRPSYATNLQAELRSVRTEQGDLALRFDPEIYSPSLRFNESADSIRLGGKQQLSRKDALLASLIAQDVAATFRSGDGFEASQEQRSYSADLQHLRTLGAFQIQSGIAVAQQDEESQTQITFPGSFPILVDQTGESRQVSLYSYAHFNPTPGLTLSAGAAFDNIDDAFVEKDSWSPKLGVIWRATPRTTLRAASFETLFGSLTTSSQNTQPRLEPVQIAGFTQLLFGGRADTATAHGLAVEHVFTTNVFVGWEASKRETERVAIPALAQPGDPLIEIALRERAQNVYLYWTPHQRLSITTRYERGEFDSQPGDFSGYSEMTTRRLPLEIRYFAPGGLTVGARATRVEQEGLFQTPLAQPGDPFAPGEDRFVVLDAFIGYRLPNRRGLLSLNADNLLDETFRFQDIDPTNPSIMPERLVSFRFTLAFD
jgi:Tfp pilus assembly protein PilF